MKQKEDGVLQGFHDWINWLNGYLWGPPMLVLLFGTHLFLTIRLKFIQKHTWTAIKLSEAKTRPAKAMSASSAP